MKKQKEKIKVKKKGICTICGDKCRGFVCDYSECKRYYQRYHGGKIKKK